MSPKPQAFSVRRQLADWTGSPRFLLLGWTSSLLLHGLLAFSMIWFATELRGCSGEPPGDPQGDFREVGIYVKQPEQPQAETSAQSESTSAQQEQAAPREAPSEESFEPDQPSTAQPSLPEEPQPILGAAPGASPPPGRTDAAPLGDVIRPSAVRPSGGSRGTAENSFFGIREDAKRFVYVLDSSGSMGRHSAIRVARAELLASLQKLDSKQMFQVIFYNESTYSMDERPSIERRLRGDRSDGLYPATSINRSMARQFIRSVQPDRGTRHLPALKAALRMKPEVIYFLTDANEPRMNAADLNEITTLNNGRARIHCIEFGKGESLSETFLKQLARMNDGTYRYRDITRFDDR